MPDHEVTHEDDPENPEDTVVDGATDRIALQKLNCQRLLADNQFAVGTSASSIHAMFAIITELSTIILNSEEEFEGLTRSTDVMIQALLTTQNKTQADVQFAKTQGVESLVQEQKTHAEATLAQATGEQEQSKIIYELLRDFAESMAASAARTTEAAKNAQADQKEALEQAAHDAEEASQKANAALQQAQTRSASITATIAAVTNDLDMLLDSICTEVVKVPTPDGIRELQRYTILAVTKPTFGANPIFIGNSVIVSTEPGDPEDPKDPEDPEDPENPEDPEDPEDPEERPSTQALLDRIVSDTSGRTPDTRQPNADLSIGLFGTFNNPIVPGVHRFTNGLNIDSGNYFIQGTGFGSCEGVTDVFIIQVFGDLNMTAQRKIVLSNGALPENVFWVVQGQANLAAGTQMVGTLVVHKNVIIGADVSVYGRIYTSNSVTFGANALIVEPKRSQESSDQSIKNRDVQESVVERLQAESKLVVAVVTKSQKKANLAAETAETAAISLTGATVKWQAETDVLIHYQTLLSAQKTLLDRIEAKRIADNIQMATDKFDMLEQKCHTDTLAATASHNAAMKQAATDAETLALSVQQQESIAREQAVKHAVMNALVPYTAGSVIVDTPSTGETQHQHQFTRDHQTVATNLAATVAATVASAVASAMAQIPTTTMALETPLTVAEARAVLAEAHVVRMEEQIFSLTAPHAGTGSAYRPPSSIVNRDARHWSRRYATDSVVSAGLAALTRRG